MERLSHMNNEMSYKIVQIKYILRKFTKFGGVLFNIKKVVNVEIQRGLQWVNTGSLIRIGIR